MLRFSRVCPSHFFGSFFYHQHLLPSVNIQDRLDIRVVCPQKRGRSPTRAKDTYTHTQSYSCVFGKEVVSCAAVVYPSRDHSVKSPETWCLSLIWYFLPKRTTEKTIPIKTPPRTFFFRVTRADSPGLIFTTCTALIWMGLKPFRGAVPPWGQTL